MKERSPNGFGVINAQVYWGASVAAGASERGAGASVAGADASVAGIAASVAGVPA